MFAADADLLAEAFGRDISVITMCSNVFNFTYVPMTFVSIRMYKTMSMATVIRIACVIMIIGAWIRSLFYYLATPVFWPILLGQTLISCSLPLFSSAITLLANKWSADSEREMVIAMCCISIPLGNLIAFIYTGFSFTDTADWSSE